MPRKRKPAATKYVEQLPTPGGNVQVLNITVPDLYEQALPMVVPAVKEMLEDAKAIIAADLRIMRKGGGIGDATGQRIRNLVASISSIQDSEKKALEGPSGLEGKSPAELAAALRAEADRLEGKLPSES